MSSYFQDITPCPGMCDVCGGSRLLTVHDHSSGMRVGDCCFPTLVFTHNVLARCWHFGIRHPEPNEFREQDNH